MKYVVLSVPKEPARKGTEVVPAEVALPGGPEPEGDQQVPIRWSWSEAVMKAVAMGLFLVLVLAGAPRDGERDGPKPVQDVEVSGVIVDGLGRPVPGATVTFSSFSSPSDDAKEVIFLTFTTDDSGRYAGVAHNWPRSTDIYKSVNKSGYMLTTVVVANFGDANLPRLQDSRLGIDRDLPYDEAVHSLFKLQGDALDQYILEVLVSHLGMFGGQQGDTPNIEDVLFASQDRFLVGLHKACANPRVGDRARTFLEFIGELQDPNELRSIKDGRRSTPRVEVSARRLNDAVQATAEVHGLCGVGAEIYIDKTVFTLNYSKALVRCHVHHGYLAGKGYKLRFERVGDKWILKAMVLAWIS